MRLKQLFFTLLLTALFALSSHAQRMQEEENSSGNEESGEKKDVLSPDSVFVSYFSINEQGAYTRYAVSKPLNQFQEYDVAKQNNQFYANLGNPGSASEPVLYNLKPTAAFRFRYDVFDPYRLKDDSIKFYISDKPFTHLRYYMGPSKEQKLDINFVQRIGSGIYLGLNARFANAPGIYTRQRANNAGANFYGAFFHPNQRYGIIFTYRTDRGINYENGGLTNEGVINFNENTITNRKQIPINLENAENRSRVRGIVLQQYFNILKPTITKKVDTISTQVPRKFDAGRIVYTLRTSRTGTAYQDLAPPPDFYGFYPSYFADTVPIFDSILIRHIENCLVYSNEVPDTLGKSFPLQYSFGIRLQTDRMTRDTTINDVFRQTVPFGMLKGIIRHKTFFKASAFIVLGGTMAVLIHWMAASTSFSENKTIKYILMSQKA